MSLRLRLALAGAVAILIALALMAFGLSQLFGAHVERRAVAEMGVQLDQVLAGMEAGQDGLTLARPPADPRFVEQMQLLAERPDPLLERDVVIITDTDPSARSAIRTELRPRGFALVIMQKDGSVGIRRPSPRDVREIMRAIDNFSIRQEEMRLGG